MGQAMSLALGIQTALCLSEEIEFKTNQHTEKCQQRYKVYTMYYASLNRMAVRQE